MKDFVGAAEMGEECEPRTYDEATIGSNAQMWIQSMKEEFDNLHKNDTWEIVTKPKDKHVLGCKWVYKMKKGLDGNICRFKSRLVAKGFNQIYGIDYFETYSPVADYTTLRLLIALAAKLNLKLSHLDFECAYLNGKLSDNEEIYMKIPPGMETTEELQGKVLKLKKCLYGLKQSGRNWNVELNNELINYGLKRSDVDRCLYSKNDKEKITLLLIYVDDIAIASNDDQFIQYPKNRLSKKFVVKDLGDMSKFLGIRITQSEDYIAIDQELLITETLEHHKMTECNPIATPAEVEKETERIDENLDNLPESYPFRALVGSLNYIANVSRPDITFAVNKLSRKLERPTIKDWIAAKRVLRYLKGTKTAKIQYMKNGRNTLELYSDADFAGSKEKKSTSGFVAKMCGASIDWYSRRQQTVALNTMESEYVALASAVQESVYIKQLLDFIGTAVELKINVDNQSCIKFAENEKGPGRHAKHISVKYHYVKDMVEKKEVSLQYIETNNNVADICTKALVKAKHQVALAMLGVH